ncbi:MAG: metallophosphoesterase [Cyanobacteria bacterium]|nr:metallophosphoesterase [Cyanobacteriota bacterium]
MLSRMTPLSLVPFSGQAPARKGEKPEENWFHGKDGSRAERLATKLGLALPHSERPVQANPLAPRSPFLPGLNRFAVIGDSGSCNPTQAAIAMQMKKTFDRAPFQTVLALGDNVYENGEPAHFYQAVYQAYQALFESGVRFLPVMGNHDVRKRHLSYLGEKQLRYFDVPRYYRFQLASDPRGKNAVDFFAIDTTVMLPGYDKCYESKEETKLARAIAKEQIEWLERQLSQSKAAFKVVYGHYPMYSSGPHAQKEGEILAKLQRKLEPLLIKHGVDLYMAGHEHLYERSEPIHGVTHVVSGAAGKLDKADFSTPAKSFTRAVGAAANHFMLFEIKPQGLAFQVITSDGSVIDSGLLTKKAAPKTLAYA